MGLDNSQNLSQTFTCMIQIIFQPTLGALVIELSTSRHKEQQVESRHNKGELMTLHIRFQQKNSYFKQLKTQISKQASQTTQCRCHSSTQNPIRQNVCADIFNIC